MRFTKDDIEKLTRLLRSDADPMWIRLRSLLAERGVNVGSTILVESFPDDTDFEFGVLITQDGKVIQYGFSYIGRDVSEGELSEWNDITAQYLSTPYSESVAQGMEIKDAHGKFAS